jgi:hypothetical protein
MSQVLYSGPAFREQLVKLYQYDKKFIDRDGEPFAYVRVTAERQKGEAYPIFTIMSALQNQMQTNNWIGCSEIPTNAVRLMPNHYLHTRMVHYKLYNIAALYMHRSMPEHYYIHNFVQRAADVPSRREIFHNIKNILNNRITPVQCELYMIQHCLTDSWANVGTLVEDDFVYWVHLKELKQKRYQHRSVPRTLDEITDYGEPGDSYTRIKLL